MTIIDLQIDESSKNFTTDHFIVYLHLNELYMLKLRNVINHQDILNFCKLHHYGFLYNIPTWVYLKYSPGTPLKSIFPKITTEHANIIENKYPEFLY